MKEFHYECQVPTSPLFSVLVEKGETKEKKDKTVKFKEFPFRISFNS